MSTQRIESVQGISRYIPILQWLPGYPSRWLRLDLVAGLTTAAVVIPQSMAYATIAGLPVEVGLYAALVPMVVYAILGTSRVLSVSVTSTISVLTAATLAPIVQSSDQAEYLTAASTLALLVGVILILSGLFRLGFLANLISQPVLTGFKAGVGVVIFVGQIAKVLGVSVEKAPILETLAALFQSLDEIHWLTFGVALVTLAVLIFLPRVAPRVPAALVAIVLAIGASALLDLEAQGVVLVGDFPSGLPSFSLPDLSLLSQLLPGAFGIALISFIESYAAGRSFTEKGEPTVSANQELLALGMANVGGGFFQAYPGGGGTSQTAVNRQAGAKTELSAIVTAAVVALTLLLLASLIGLMPQATLGAIVMVAAAGLINIRSFQAIRRIRNTEFVWSIAAFIGVVLLGTLEGILIAVLISVLTVFYQSSYPPVYALGRKPGTDVFRPLSEKHPEDEVFDGLLMLRSEGRMLFSSAPNTTDKLWALIDEAEPRVVAIDFSAIPDLEYTALNLLTEFEEQLADSGITLWLAALNPEPLQIVEHSPLGENLGHERMFFNMEQVVETFQSMNANGSEEPIQYKGERTMSNLLPSWNDGKTKETILNYVHSVTDPRLATFVPVEDRIAAFDNDGCCWNEKPAYIQLFFSLARLKQMATDDPKLRSKPHFRAAYEGDMDYFAQLDPHAGGDVKDLMRVVFDSHAGMTQDEFEAMVRDFMTTAKHPHFNVPFKQLVYQPMVELIHYLHDNEFKVFLCSAGGMSFMRAVSEDVYGIPKERVIGSNISFETKMTDDGPVVVRKPGIIEPIDDGPGKPINIELHIGRKPILAGGNSDGDLHMLWLAQTGAHPSLSLLVHHDDAEREYKYDIGSEKTLKMAPERGWYVVSMKQDWKKVFAWE